MANSIPKESKVVYLQIGQNYENLARTKQFDVSEWVSEFPDATIYMLFRRPGEEAVAPVQTTLEDGILTWTISNWETGIIGVGFAEIRAIDSSTGMVKKSHVIPCSIEASATDEDVAPAYPSWVDRMITMNEHLESVYDDFEEELSDGITSIQTEAETQKDAAVDAIQAKGDAVNASIPMSYTDLIENLAGFTYNPNRHYEHGEFVWYDDKLWQRRTDSASIVGNWDPDDWLAAPLSTFMTEVGWDMENYADQWGAMKSAMYGAGITDYESENAYTAGDIVWYGWDSYPKGFYRAKVDKAAGDTFTPANWEKLEGFDDKITSLKSAISDEDNKINLLKVTEANTSSVTVTMETGKAISNKADNVYNGNIVTSTNAAYCSIPVATGECYFVTTRGGGNYSAVAFFDSSTFDRTHYKGANGYQSSTVALTDMLVLIPTGVTYMGVNTTNYADYPISVKKLNPTKSVDALYQAGYAYQDDVDRVQDEIDYVEESLEALAAITTRPVFNPDTFDSVDEGIAYNAVNQSGTTWNSAHSYIKAVHTGEVYKISTTVVANSNYYAVLYYNNTTYLSGEVQGTSSQQPISNHEFTIPNNANKIIVCTYGTVTPVLTKEGVAPYVDTTVASVMQNYAIYDGTTLSIKCRYNSSEDLVVQMKRRGNNNLFDFDKVFTVDRSDVLDNNLSASRQIFTTGTDSFSPYQIAALNNVDGDAESSFYTGGNHNHDDVPTASCTDVSIYFDGKKSNTFSGLCGNIRASWTNLIQGWNTWKSDGTGRAILKEEIVLDIFGNQFNATVTITPLEDLSIKYYNGLQSVVSAYETILFVGGLNRDRITVGTTENSGDLKARRSVAVNNTTGDCMETFVANEDLGTFDLTGVLYSMFTQNNKVYYAIVRTTERQLDQNNVYCLFGYYKFYSNS